MIQIRIFSSNQQSDESESRNPNHYNDDASYLNSDHSEEGTWKNEDSDRNNALRNSNSSLPAYDQDEYFEEVSDLDDADIEPELDDIEYDDDIEDDIDDDIDDDDGIEDDDIEDDDIEDDENSDLRNNGGFQSL